MGRRERPERGTRRVATCRGEKCVAKGNGRLRDRRAPLRKQRSKTKEWGTRGKDQDRHGKVLLVDQRAANLQKAARGRRGATQSDPESNQAQRYKEANEKPGGITQSGTNPAEKSQKVARYNR